MYQAVLVEKYTSSSFCWHNLIKNKTIVQLSVEEILSKYQGFEGESISFFFSK